MASRGTLIALELDQQHVVAVRASVSRKRVRVLAGAAGLRPKDVDPADTDAFGAWVRTVLDNEGIGAGKAIIVVPRGDVILKQLSFQTGGQSSLATDDLVGMVRMQVTRQLTMRAEGASIDFLPLEKTEEDGAVAVLAGALPAQRLEWIREVAQAAGLKIDAITLKASGVAALVAGDDPPGETDEPSQKASATLAISLGQSAAEFVVVHGGRQVFSRAADVRWPESQDHEAAYIEQIAVEAKRTWMSYRAGADSVEITQVEILSDRDLASQIGDACGSELEVDACPMRWPDIVQGLDEVAEPSRTYVAPLVGTLATAVRRTPRLDFAHPREAPDHGAARRQRILMSVFGLIVVGGAAYVFAQHQLGILQQDVTKAETKAKQLRNEYFQHVRNSARLDHIKQFEQIEVDWVSHIQQVAAVAPDPGTGVIDAISGVLSSGVTFSTDGSYTAGTWGHRTIVDLSVSGRARNRDVINQTRARFIDATPYQISSPGPDVEQTFRFTLRDDRTAKPADSDTEESESGGAE